MLWLLHYLMIKISIMKFFLLLLLGFIYLILDDVRVPYKPVVMCEHNFETIACTGSKRVYLDIESIKYHFKEGDSCSNAADVGCTLKTSYVVNQLLFL